MDDLHFVSVIGIVQKGDKFLLCKRCDDEISYPSKWCLPGGKVDREDFIDTPKDTKEHWLNILEKVVKREIKEETDLEVENLKYVSSAVSMRSNGNSYIVITFRCDYTSGEVKLDPKELDRSEWVSIDDIEKYDVISNDLVQIRTTYNR